MRYTAFLHLYLRAVGVAPIALLARAVSEVTAAVFAGLSVAAAARVRGAVRSFSPIGRANFVQHQQQLIDGACFFNGVTRQRFIIYAALFHQHFVQHPSHFRPRLAFQKLLRQRFHQSFQLQVLLKQVREVDIAPQRTQVFSK